MHALLALVFALVTTRVAAQEHAYVHVVRAGESLASLARTYYGDTRREVVLATENGLEPHASVPEGTRLLVPAIGYHRVQRGDSWRSVAERYFGDAARAPALVRANNAKASSPPDENAQLIVPYPLRHLVRGSDSLSSIAQLYYGTRDEARALRAFNGGRARPARGSIVLVPLSDLKLSPQGIERVEATLAQGVSASRGRDARSEIARDLPRMHEYVQTGRFVEAIALGNQLLGRGPLTGNQELSLQRDLATAYVALDREDLAVAAFARALERQPDLELDSVRTSPRVLGALEAAKQQRHK